MIRSGTESNPALQTLRNWGVSYAPGRLNSTTSDDLDSPGDPCLSSRCVQTIIDSVVTAWPYIQAAERLNRSSDLNSTCWQRHDGDSVDDEFVLCWIQKKFNFGMSFGDDDAFLVTQQEYDTLERMADDGDRRVQYESFGELRLTFREKLLRVV